MKWIIVLALALGFETATAQNLGEAYDWLKDSYKRIPMKSSMPFYDTAVSGLGYSQERLAANAKYYIENVMGSVEVPDLSKKMITADGSYLMYTNDLKDEEHTYVVKYKMDITIKNKKYAVAMHDFDISYLSNKVEFSLKYKGAKNYDGKSNQFRAIFHSLNEKPISEFVEAMSMNMLPADSTASN